MSDQNLGAQSEAELAELERRRNAYIAEHGFNLEALKQIEREWLQEILDKELERLGEQS